MLTDRDIQMLDFERRWWREPSAKDEAIRQEFGVSPTRYFQRLNTVISEPAALDYDPVLVRMLLRRREG